MKAKTRLIQYYVLEVLGDLEPTLHGPYQTAAGRDRKARALRAADDSQENGIYRLDVDVTAGGAAKVDSYSGLELGGQVCVGL